MLGLFVHRETNKIYFVLVEKIIILESLPKVRFPSISQNVSHDLYVDFVSYENAF